VTGSAVTGGYFTLQYGTNEPEADDILHKVATRPAPPDGQLFRPGPDKRFVSFRIVEKKKKRESKEEVRYFPQGFKKKTQPPASKIYANAQNLI